MGEGAPYIPYLGLSRHGRACPSHTDLEARPSSHRDPWPKARHRRRRFLRRGNIETLRCKLKPGGSIFVVTDYFDYYLHTKVLFLLHEGLTLIPQPPSASVFRSVFAQRFADRGKEIQTLTVKKTSPTERKTAPTEKKTSPAERKSGISG